MFVKRYSRIVIPSEVEGSFLHTGIAPYVRQRKRGNLLRRKQERAECKEDFSTALEMTVWGGRITHVPYKGYVGKMPLPQRHPERSRGIFLAHWYSALCETAENGKPLAKGVRNDGVQGRFLDCARNDGMGGWITHVPYKGYVGKTPLPQRHPERSRGIFFVGGKRERARQREMGNTVSQERRGRCFP